MHVLYLISVCKKKRLFSCDCFTAENEGLCFNLRILCHLSSRSSHLPSLSLRFRRAGLKTKPFNSSLVSFHFRSPSKLPDFRLGLVRGLNRSPRPNTPCESECRDEIEAVHCGLVGPLICVLYLNQESNLLPVVVKAQSLISLEFEWNSGMLSRRR
jgi:hypothetical protein